MAPKKKGGKKAADDWENELGETLDSIAAATQDAKNTEAEQDGVPNGDADGEEGGGGGGLMAALKKNKERRKKKGKAVEDFVEGEDPPAAEGAPAPTDLDAKAPVEASIEDEDVFATPVKKVKGGKKQPEKPAEEETAGGEDDEEGGGLKSAKQKEKERKEREKQRKKDQVGRFSQHLHFFSLRSSCSAA